MKTKLLRAKCFAFVFGAVIAFNVKSASASAITDVDLTYGGPEVIEDFSSVGTEYEFIFTVPTTQAYFDFVLGGSASDTWSILIHNPNITDGPYSYSSPYSGNFSLGEETFDIYVTLTAAGSDPYGGFDLTNNAITLSAPAATPLPAAFPLFATGLGAMGLLGWRRKRKNTAAIAA
jgi:hypothetical protein